MTQQYAVLASDWVDYAKESLQSRIHHASDSTGKVLFALQAIAAQLHDEKNLQGLLSLKSGETTSDDLLNLLRDVLKQLDKNDALAQLIAPLFTALQFEDRSRQKLESILNILSVWLEVRTDQTVMDEDLAARLMMHVVSGEQQTILAQYFPDYIQEIAEEDDGIDLF